MAIIIKQPGMLTSIQDFGRYGAQKFGIGTSGAMDQRSLAIANILVDNNKDEAGIEVTMLGPSIVFEEDCVIAITGGNLSPSIAGVPIEMYSAIEVKAGSMLMFGAPVTGCRAYIAVAGGLEIKQFFNSASTHLRSGIGGFEGRKLQKEDRIDLKSPCSTLKAMNKRVISAEDFSSITINIRVIVGPQDDCFTEEGKKTFFTTPYQVTNDMDRMGMRLSGEIIEHIGDGNIVSDAITFGAIQIPTNGLPIIMMAECQTIGGYTKIAGVISADLPLLAQAKPGTTIHFQKVSVQRAHKIYRMQQSAYTQLENEITSSLTFWDKIQYI